MNETTAPADFPHGIEVCVGPYILNDKGQVLLIKSPKWQKWIICGGHVEPGEHLEDACKRETLEELGIHIQIIDLLRVFDNIVTPPTFKRQAHFIFFDYIAKPLDKNFTFNEEVSQYQWFNIDDIIDSPDLNASCHDGLVLLKQWLATHQEAIK